jgi:hypothetical protein
MNKKDDPPPVQPPTPKEIHQALEMYFSHAYPGRAPETVTELLPPEGEFDVAAWMMSDAGERDPSKADLPELRSVAFRLGNMFYPHMKFRLSRPPKGQEFFMSVDAHDSVLQAEPGTPDHKMLEELKTANTQIVQAIQADWDEAGLPTERNYMRRMVQQAKEKAARHRDQPEE